MKNAQPNKTNETAHDVLTELHTFRDMVRWGASQFNAAGLHFGHGTTNAWDEALLLVRHALHLSPDEDKHVADARLLTCERQEILALFQRRILERIPAPYLIHQAWFAGLPFYVDAHVIIPRSPIAELIEQRFSPWLYPSELKLQDRSLYDSSPQHKATTLSGSNRQDAYPASSMTMGIDEPICHILDLCTGSGCIAIACAFAFPDAQIDAVDISSEALAVARKNVSQHQVGHAVHLIQSDVWQNLPQADYQLIVCNPPYVDAEDMQQLPAEYRHEPTLALAGGEDGLDLVDRVLKKAADYLSPGGVLIVEVGNSAPALEVRFPDYPFTWLTFERGGHGVFLLTKEQLIACRKK